MAAALLASLASKTTKVPSHEQNSCLSPWLVIKNSIVRASKCNIVLGRYCTYVHIFEGFSYLIHSPITYSATRRLQEDLIAVKTSESVSYNISMCILTLIVNQEHLKWGHQMFDVPNTTKFWQEKSFWSNCMLSNINDILISPKILHAC